MASNRSIICLPTGSREQCPLTAHWPRAGKGLEPSGPPGASWTPDEPVASAGSGRGDQSIPRGPAPFHPGGPRASPALIGSEQRAHARWAPVGGASWAKLSGLVSPGDLQGPEVGGAPRASQADGQADPLIS